MVHLRANLYLTISVFLLFRSFHKYLKYTANCIVSVCLQLHFILKSFCIIHAMNFQLKHILKYLYVVMKYYIASTYLQNLVTNKEHNADTGRIR